MTFPIRQVRLPALVLLLAAALSCLASTSLATGEKNVLILFHLGQDNPVHAELAKGFRERLSQGGTPVRISYEYLDLPRFAGEKAYLEEVARFFRAKYAALKPDVVVSGGPLREFLDAYGQAMFPGVPIVFPKDEAAALEAPPGRESAASGQDGLAKSVEIIFRLRPFTRTVHVVLGNSGEERALREAVSRVAKAWQGRARFVFTDGLAYPELLARVRAAGRNDAVLFLRFLRDARGDSFVPEEVQKELCRESSAPVFGVVSHPLGQGMVGGYLFSFELFGRRLAEETLAALGAPEGRGRAAPVEACEYAFDWRQLRRWHIDESVLPEGSRVAFRELSAWDRYGQYVFVGAALLLLETALVVGLAVNRSRRRKVEAALTRLNESLEEAVAERTRELGDANAQLTRAKTLLEELNQRLDLASRTDSLTGLPNRRHMEEVFAAGLARSIRTGESFSLVMCDLDHFKAVNDAFGHDAGDALLKLLASDLSALVRPYDTLARWGGEEFLLFMPSTGAEGAVLAAERILGEIVGRSYPCGGARRGVTLTLGVAAWRPGDSVDDVLKRADTAMYEGKRSGRNRVVSA